jgi:hypothetical protein
MIRHIVLLTLRDDAGPAAVTDIREALEALPAQIPAIRSYDVAADAGLAGGNADLAVIAVFDDQDGWAEYRDHPAHRRVIEERILPVLAERRAIQSAL